MPASENMNRIGESITGRITAMGHPAEFAQVIIMSLGTEKTLARMDAYLAKNRRLSAEEIADEMLAIKADFARYREKKIAEYYNSKLNELMNDGLDQQ